METEALPRSPATPLEEGTIVDGFRLEEPLHRGGMATLWRVTRTDADNTDGGLPLIMKVPRIKGGDDPATIVGFEVEQMILPALSGTHVPKFVDNGAGLYSVVAHFSQLQLDNLLADAVFHQPGGEADRLARLLLAGLF